MTSGGISVIHTVLSFGINLDQAAKGPEKNVGFDGFTQVRVQAGLHAALHVFVKGVGGQGDDRDGAGIFAFHCPDCSRGCEAVHLGHAQVH